MRRRGAWLVALVATGILVASAVPGLAAAETYKVTKVADGVNGSLRKAVDKANDHAGDDTIVLKGQKPKKKGKPRKKTFKLTVCGPSASEEDLNTDGDLDHTDGAKLVIDGRGGTIRNRCNGERLLHDVAVGSEGLVIRALTLEDGDALGDGGAISSTDSPLAVTRSTLRDNHSAGNGGAIRSGELNLRATAVVDNTATAFGGGLHVGSGGTIADSVVGRNRADGGGGIEKAFGTLTIIRTAVSGNHAEFNGGGIETAFDHTTIADSTVSGNRAEANGGGIAKAFNTMLITDTTVSGNEAGSAGVGGGGISSVFSTTTIINATVTGNATGVGAAGISAGDTLPLANSIVADNSGPDCAAIIVSEGYNIDSDDSCGLTGTGDQPDTDPELLGLADNGGATLTHALRKGSPAINAANPAEPGSEEFACEPTDQRGAPRKGGCDVGAYERTTCEGVVVNRVGTNGKDRLKGTKRNDGILGLGGKDKLAGKKGKDGLCGGRGKDKLKGGPANDKLDGGPGRDRCDGGEGNDQASACEIEAGIR